MDIARPRLGVGRSTNAWSAARAVRELQAGLTHGHTGQLGRGVQRHRVHADGSIIAVNLRRIPRRRARGDARLQRATGAGPLDRWTVGA